MWWWCALWWWVALWWCCCPWARDASDGGGGQPKVKLGEEWILGEGVWLLLLWLLERTRPRVCSDGEQDRELRGGGGRERAHAF